MTSEHLHPQQIRLEREMEGNDPDPDWSEHLHPQQIRLEREMEGNDPDPD
jgi:hypothetical protein